MKKVKGLFLQVLMLLLTAFTVLAIGSLFYWIFTQGSHYFNQTEGATSPFSSPFLWAAVILVAIASVINRIWRWYTEKRFIKQLKKRH